VRFCCPGLSTNFDLTLWIFRKQERFGFHFSLPDVHTSVVTPKPANGGQGKTGQRE